MIRIGWIVLAALTMGIGGCGAQQIILGTDSTYLFTVADGLSLPGEEVPLSAWLRGGDFLRPVPGQVIRFYAGAELVQAAETNDGGVATVSFTPAKPGEYFFTAEVSATGLEDDPPKPQDLMILCCPADTPILVVDLDKTVVASGFHMVLIGDPKPMARSAEVLKRLTGQYRVVYLTHRPDYFSIKSKTWLREKGYPRAPVLLSDVRGFLKGSGAFKGEVIRSLKERFRDIRVGIGDKISDAVAYHENGLRSFLIVQIPDSQKSEDYQKLSENLEELPERVQVVDSWGQIEKVIYSGASYPRPAMQQRLLNLAKQAEGSASSAAGRSSPKDDDDD